MQINKTLKEWNIYMVFECVDGNTTQTATKGFSYYVVRIWSKVVRCFDFMTSYSRHKIWMSVIENTLFTALIHKRHINLILTPFNQFDMNSAPNFMLHIVLSFIQWCPQSYTDRHPGVKYDAQGAVNNGHMDI